MILNWKSKTNLRKYIEGELKDTVGNKKLKLDKYILKELLFETVTINKEEGIVMKLPVWSGKFLQHIDLSEVDFEDVSWAELSCKSLASDLICNSFGKDFGIDEKTEEKVRNQIERIRVAYFKEHPEEGHRVLYYNTNAEIDLSKSFEAKHYNTIDIRYCVFIKQNISAFTDGVPSNIDEINITNSDISTTGLVIPNHIYLYGRDSDLTGINLSGRQITADGYCNLECENDLKGCKLVNTGIQIELDPKKFKNIYRKKLLRETMEFNWIGCYVNGVKILNDKEKREIREAKQKEYEAMGQEKYIQPIVKSIEEFQKSKK